MDFQTPFRPSGPLIAVLGSTTPPSGTLIAQTGDWCALIYNRSATQDGYLAYGPTSSNVAGAVIPVVGVPSAPGTAQMVQLPRGSLQTFTFSGPTFFGGLTAAGNITIDITPGTGS